MMCSAPGPEPQAGHWPDRRGKSEAILSIFIQHEDRILRARLLHRLNNLSGERADVSATVAANLGLIANAAQ
jgi:hypothetical protein